MAKVLINNPVNKPTNLNLPNEKIQNFANLSIHPGKKDEFVLGYYDPNKTDGYIELANKRDASYFSMDSFLYNETGFSSNPGDFWRVNQQAVLNAIEERKTFVLNVKVNEIDTSKSTWAEVQLILQPGNNYVLVPGGSDGYDMLVPVEALK